MGWSGCYMQLPTEPLTPWKAEDKYSEQSPNPAHHKSHSLPEGQREAW